LVIHGVRKVETSLVKAYAKDLHILLEESEISERKAFLKSFIKRITVDGEKVTVNYKLPLPDRSKDEFNLSVLPIDTSGGAEGIRTPYLLNAIEALSRLSYSPTENLLYYDVTACATPVVKVSSSSATSTMIMSPSLNSPFSTLFDSGFSTYRSTARLSGRAP
jgi:hypothetical protein